MAVRIGSARHDENGRYAGGRKGDQTGNEVSIQNFYVHRKGWIVLRPKSVAHADMIGERMYRACGNPNIGYCQSHRSSIYKYGTATNTPCECDCSSLVSTCCIAAGLSESIFFAGNNMRTTYNLIDACNKTGHFDILTSSNYTRSKDYLNMES